VSGAESFAFSRYDNYTHGLVGRDRAELSLQLRQHRFR
jgi:hypothetical protein